ncbi:hypothetical protein SAMN05216370_4319 [Pseudomonas peli]|uniref:Uncharacterized protein n=1 Tax=Pseudomonas peli TaxID=592361 RepID=A0AB37ZD48_9PSED|nr:hypothetical protein [Pseudomonas peli]SCW88514.1 hypothetical protein SAMN05216370_4319 [Pseudomonas peli]|tara:strand:- start:4134 stop:4259 length:126 start_codon:yes stop_codon:yes gene_type:complete
MQTLITFTIAITLSAAVLADHSQQQQDGKGLYPEWLINHDG